MTGKELICHAKTSTPEAQEVIRVLAQVMAEGGITQFVAEEGKALQFMPTLIDQLTRTHHYTLYEIPDKACMALVHEVHPIGDDSNTAVQHEVQHDKPQPAQQPLSDHAQQESFLESLVNPRRLYVLRQLSEELEEVMMEQAKLHGPLLHLHFLGVHPPQQGQGLGGRMLTHLGQLADAQGKWTYLEASTTDSQRLYARYGFRDVCTFPLGREGDWGPSFYIMIRPPAAHA